MQRNRADQPRRWCRGVVVWDVAEEEVEVGLISTLKAQRAALPIRQGAMKALSERTKPRLITSANASPNKGKRVL
jgi:hypothetical protein